MLQEIRTMLSGKAIGVTMRVRTTTGGPRSHGEDLVGVNGCGETERKRGRKKGKTWKWK